MTLLKYTRLTKEDMYCLKKNHEIPVKKMAKSSNMNSSTRESYVG